MEIEKTGKFITDFYGSAPALGAETVIAKWMVDKQNKWLSSWVEQIAKKGQNAINVLEEVLSVFHRNINGEPVLGNWMLRKCMIVTGQAIFNALQDKSHPKKAIIPMAIQLVEPIHINLYNGDLVKNPHGIKTYTVTVKNKASFFKAYEFIKAGSTFKSKIYFDDEILCEDHINRILSKCGSIGVGAFRERFGKFEWI